MKILEKVLRVSLVLLIVLSIYFSFNIWVSSSPNKFLSQNNQNTSILTSERNLKDVFLPLHIIKFENEQAEMTNSESLISELLSELSKSSFGKMVRVTQGNTKVFETYRSSNKGIILQYDGAFLIEEFIHIFDLNLITSQIHDIADLQFDTIIINLENDAINFLDFNSQSVYAAPASWNPSQFMRLLNKEKFQFYTVQRSDIFQSNQYDLMEEINLKKYSYILATQPVARFRNAFFKQTNDIRTNVDSQELIYSSGNERLIIDEKSGAVQFTGEVNEQVDNNIYTASFPYIKKLGISVGNLKYFDTHSERIDYRTFVEGYPVFGEKNKGQVHFTFKTHEQVLSDVSIQTNMDSFQVPIPSEETVTLENSKSLLDQLTLAGISMNKIEAKAIGYTWQILEETKQVVALTPEWYIRYEDQWYPKWQLLQDFSTMEGP